MKKKFFLGALLLVLLLSGCQKEGQAVKEAVFQGEVQALEAMETPEALPTELCGDYNAWDRTTEWSEMAETEDGSARLYANRDDYEAMYLLWNGRFYVLPWADEREMELDVDLYLDDLDGSGEQEVIAIAHSRGSAGWGRDQVYIIDWSGSQVTFPLEELESWVQDNLTLTDYVLTFFGLSLSVENVYDLSQPVIFEGVAEDSELTESIPIIWFTFDGGLSMKIQLKARADVAVSVGVLTGDFTYQSGAFAVQNLSLNPWEFW